MCWWLGWGQYTFAGICVAFLFKFKLNEYVNLRFEFLSKQSDGIRQQKKISYYKQILKTPAVVCMIKHRAVCLFRSLCICMILDFLALYVCCLIHLLSSFVQKSAKLI